MSSHYEIFNELKCLECSVQVNRLQELEPHYAAKHPERDRVCERCKHCFNKESFSLHALVHQQEELPAPARSRSPSPSPAARTQPPFPPPSMVRTTDRVPAQVITQESLLVQNEGLRKVTDLLALTEHHARTLLMHHRWDVQRIFELLDQKGRNRLFAEAGITIMESNNKVLSRRVTCQICFQDVPVKESSEMDCGHQFCNIVT